MSVSKIPIFLFVTLKLSFVSDLPCNSMLYPLLNLVFYLGRGHKKSILDTRSQSCFVFWNITTVPHHHIFGKMFYCFACAATIGSCTNSCEHVYSFLSSVQMMNIKTIKSENILAWNTREHYFVDIYKTKHLHREEKQFKVQRRKWKKLDVTGNIISGYAVPIRIESLIMLSVLNEWSYLNSGKIIL